MRRQLYRLVAGWVVFGMLLAGCGGQDDIRFARSVLNGLIDGRYSVRSSIDWAHLKMMSIDMSLLYGAFKTEGERTDYERSFIENFARSYREQGAKKKAFFNWRLGGPSDDPKITNVVANVHDQNYAMLFVIRRDGFRKKLVEMGAFRLLDKGQVPPAAEPPQAGDQKAGE